MGREGLPDFNGDIRARAAAAGPFSLSPGRIFVRHGAIMLEGDRQ